ncbi:MAG TPA: D-glycerate dehydrogenase [Thermodesulfobacteriota bacterium]|nr:D-glycerate dehydrogenase [Thermodesulfobacteriota bacterium]
MRVFVTRLIPEAGLTLLRKGAEVDVWPGPEDGTPSREEIIQGVRKADVLLSLLTETIDRSIMEANPKLLGIADHAVGYNNIDVEAATQLGIPVTNTPGVLTDTTADLAWALIMAVARNIVQGHEYVKEGRFKIWGPKLLLGIDVSPGGGGKPKTLGIIGFGRIGQTVFKRSKGFDMRVLAYDPFQKETIEQTEGVEYRSLPDLLRQSDFITLHTALSENTRHLIGEKELLMMKPTAFLINTSRGPIIDERALVKALQEKRIGGVGLDVYENEPELAPGLLECENVVLLPHLGSASRETRDKMATMAAANALALLKKEKAPNTVNPEVYGTNAYRRRMGLETKSNQNP